MKIRRLYPYPNFLLFLIRKNSGCSAFGDGNSSVSVTACRRIAGALRRPRPDSKPEATYLGGARSVPPLRARPERLHLHDALGRAHPRHASPHRGSLGAGDLVEQRLPPLLPRPAGVAELQRPVPPLGPAPPAVEPGDVPRHARAAAAAGPQGRHLAPLSGPGDPSEATGTADLAHGGNA